MAYLVLALSLVPTGIVYYRVKANVELRDRMRFERVIRDEQSAIEQRILRYVDEMTGLRALFAASIAVSAEEWQNYISTVDIKQLYPGIRALGYLERVDAAQRDSFLRRLRVRAGTDTAIEPEGDRPIYFPVNYLTCFDPNVRGGLGKDHFANPERQTFMAAARDTGKPMATRKLVLTSLVSTNVPGFVIYLPVYRRGAPTMTVEQRRAALQGFIFANFDSDKLLGSLPGGSNKPIVDWEIFDGPDMTPAHLLHDNDHTLHATESHPARLAQQVVIPVLNRNWTLYFSSLPAFEAESQQNLPFVALISSLMLSALLFGIALAQVKARAQAESATAKLQKSEAALAAEKELLAVTLDSIGDGVITTDTQGRILSLNKAARLLTGWPQTEAAGKPLALCLNVVQEASREPRPDPVEAIVRTGDTASLEKSAILIARDGTERAIADSAAPIRDGQGKIIGIVVVFRDVTERQRSEAELLKDSKLESVGLLAGGIAHDFNNILQGIIGNLSLARMSAHSTEKMLERLAAIEKSSNRARDLTQQLVMFSRGGAPIRKQVQLSGIIRDATLYALQGSNAQCECAPVADLWPVEVDEGQFRQVIHNIALNAVQAMPDGGKVEVCAENVELAEGSVPSLKAGKYVKISIRDHGTGIHAEHLPRIFDPYFSTRNRARGLGLASAYSVIRKHEGQIRVESKLGHGSNFQIYLPASLKSAPARTTDTDQKRLFARGRILIMDDEDDILSLAREMLQIMGYEVETARDGAEALERYTAAQSASQPFAAVIMDLTVPEGMGGKEAIRRLKELDPQARAIVSSGYSYDPVMANFQDYGFCGVMPKPYIMEELGRVLGEAVGRKAAPPATSVSAN